MISLVSGFAGRNWIDPTTATAATAVADLSKTGAAMALTPSIAAMGAHSLCMFLEGSKFKVTGPDDRRKHIDAAGVDKTIMCSDLGQPGVFDPLEGFRRGARMCLELGYDDADVHKMVSTNAAGAFGLERDVARVTG